ncbi:MAG: tRNA (cytidine(34)-2'-O)-methyltransferase [Holosporales bacterium]|jgi:tRNA (cytidine/uridine-2'-O-)-methyltransferase|nr:tRNA (cytidine(34)-2'-O)-methyltransferase [Holosporales bacterium]
MIRLALYETEIAQNLGAMLRVCACFGVPVDVIEPLGFLWDDKRMRRAGMDYIDIANVTCHKSFSAFLEQKKGRIVLLDTKADQGFWDIRYELTDIIMVGKESCGVPNNVYDICDVKVSIPMVSGVRSLNVTTAAAIGLTEAIRQTAQLQF